MGAAKGTATEVTPSARKRNPEQSISKEKMESKCDSGLRRSMSLMNLCLVSLKIENSKRFKEIQRAS